MDELKRAFSLSRRGLLTSAAAFAAASIAARDASAAERCVVGTWGGDYANLLRQNIDDPILKPKGVDVVQAVGDEAPRMAQMFAKKVLPKGTMDIACVGATNGYRAATSGLVETLDPAKVPNLKNVVAPLRSGNFMPDQFVPHIYSAQVIAYNPNTVKNPPQTWEELLDKRWKGKVGVQSKTATWVIQGAALAVGSGPTDFDKAKEYLVKLNANGLRLYPETDDFAPAFKSGEIDIGIIWLARTVMWRNGGFPVRGQFPKEGAILYVSGMVMPKNAPDKEGAFQYMNALLEPSAQQGFAQHMGYLPTVDNAKLTGQVADDLALPKDAKLVQPDYEVMAKATPELSDWWLKNIERKQG
jgi:putative spermidine/putrescine transport system substrate-binding protein